MSPPRHVLEDREPMQQREPCIGDIAPRSQPGKFGLAHQHTDRAVPCRGAHQVHRFEIPACGELRDARVRDARQPAQRDLFQIGKCSKHLKPAIGQDAPRAPEFHFFELRQARQVRRALIVHPRRLQPRYAARGRADLIPFLLAVVPAQSKELLLWVETEPRLPQLSGD